MSEKEVLISNAEIERVLYIIREFMNRHHFHESFNSDMPKSFKVSEDNIKVA